ncbi:MAG TPA: amidohydrolase [Candidatus Omnitrophota bacterium]|nr:amidohydrolase [Candidatus Omnitrophota bacterium]
MEADIKITKGMVLTMDESLTLYPEADVLIKGSKIVGIGKDSPAAARKTIDARGKLVMPGLINCHTHAAMTLFRGLADDLPLESWLNDVIFPLEKKYVDPEFLRVGSSLAAIEMIRSGTTAFTDMYFYEEAAAEALKPIGIRAFLGEGVLDFPTPDSPNADDAFRRIEALNDKWGKDELIHPLIAPHAPYTCGPENLKKCRQLSEKLGLPLHIHLSETAGEVAQLKLKYGVSPVEHLERAGFLCPQLSAAHCVHLSKAEIEILKKYDVKVAHCQESNMKLASGWAPVVEMQYAGLTVGLGTDGAASNNNLDLFDEMDAVAKVHKLVRNDPTVMDAKTVLKMATSDAARVMLKEKEIGSLKPGMTADIIILDLDRPHLTPLYNVYSHLVYSAGGSEVTTVIINGRMVMEDKKILTTDERGIMDEANRIARRINDETKS